MLSRKKRRQAEDIAAANFDRAGQYYRTDVNNHKRLAKEWTKDDIEALRDGFGQQYGSILTSILISIMMKIAFKLIEKWIQNKIDDLLE
jgi:hypothetical protein